MSNKIVQELMNNESKRDQDSIKQMAAEDSVGTYSYWE